MLSMQMKWHDLRFTFYGCININNINIWLHGCINKMCNLGFLFAVQQRIND